jgi:hypothetical protein
MTEPTTKGTIHMAVSSGDDREIIATLPSGRVIFMGWLKAIWFGWCAMRDGYKVEVEE